MLNKKLEKKNLYEAYNLQHFSNNNNLFNNNNTSGWLMALVTELVLVYLLKDIIQLGLNIAKILGV